MKFQFVIKKKKKLPRFSLSFLFGSVGLLWVLVCLNEVDVGIGKVKRLFLFSFFLEKLRVLGTRYNFFFFLNCHLKKKKNSNPTKKLFSVL